MSEKVDALQVVFTGYSEKLGTDVSYRAAFIEAGYDYLANQNNNSKAMAFADVLEADFLKQGISLESKKEFLDLAVEVAERIAKNFNKLNAPNPTLLKNQLKGFSLTKLDC